MRKRTLLFVACLLGLFVGASQSDAADGIVLINQDRVLAAGGFPFVISAPGSYRLSGDLDVSVAVDPPNTTAISVNPLTAGPVHIDLNGFSIIGPGTAGTGVGIDFLANERHSVRNGTVRGMGSHGVHMATGSGLIEYVSAVDNGGYGIRIIARGIIRRCRAARNGSDGLRLDQFVNARHNLTQGNGAWGMISGQKGTTYEGNIAWDNTSGGIYADVNSVVRGNIASDNTGAGIRCWNACTASGNLSGGNTGNGFTMGGAANFRHNVSFQNGGSGVNPGNGSVVWGSVLASNTGNGLGFAPDTLGTGQMNFSFNDTLGNGDLLFGDLGSGPELLESNSVFCEPTSCNYVE